VVQLRAENLRFSSYNLVGFQNHLKFPEQKRILRKIPGLEHAEFLRLGQIHRNTYINAPRLLGADLRLRAAPNVFIAGQLCGVEGYVECIATGFLAGVALAQQVAGSGFTPPPRATALGSLIHYISHADPGNYQPANIAFDLLPPPENLPGVIARNRRARREAQCARALANLQQWLHELDSAVIPSEARNLALSPSSTGQGEIPRAVYPEPTAEILRCAQDDSEGLRNDRPETEARHG
jgi:methylenetetrahydrofolate--tRNA-(uracil-5-)-methyltransferase